MSPFSEGTRAYGGPVTPSGPRVLLFVQTGDGRPKCLNGRRWDTHPEAFWGHGWRGMVEQITAGHDRWWLVECENAEAGRHIIGWNIASHGLFDSAQGGGRILASGGRS